jgi:phage shock protein PspC (stress-responsive transcriptional regulator)
MTETTDTLTPPDQAPARRLSRVDDGRWLGGVAAGLGRYFDVNPLVYRIAFAALAFAGGTGILLYVAAWLVIPSERREESIAVEGLRQHRDRPWVLLGGGLLLLGAVLALSEANFWPGSGNVWLAAVLGGAALVWWHVARRDDSPPVTAAAEPAAAAEPTAAEAPVPPAPPRAPRKPSLLAPVLGALLAAAGVFGLLAVLDVYSIDIDLALAAAVAIVGAAVAVGAFTGHRVGALVLVGLVLLGGFAGAASVPVSISSGTGDKLERPLDAAALQSSYEFGIGDYTVDLSHVELRPGRTNVDVSLGIGDLLVTVPEGVGLEIDAHAGAGDVIVLGEQDDGLGADRQLSRSGPTPDAPVLVLEADIGLGQVEVRRG